MTGTEQSPLSKARAAVQRAMAVVCGKKPKEEALGYVRCKLNTNDLPEGQKEAACYMPVSKNVRQSIDFGVMRELTAESDPVAAKTIKNATEANPSFHGLIFEPQPGKTSEIKTTMQLYADRYNMPVCSMIEGQFTQLYPSLMLAKQRANVAPDKK